MEGLPTDRPVESTLLLARYIAKNELATAAPLSVEQKETSSGDI